MEDLNAIQAAYVTLSEIEDLIKKTFGESVYIHFKQSDKISLLQTNEFVLTFSHINFKYYLSFCIGIECRLVSELTILILSQIHEKFITILDDHFYDHRKMTLVYGDEAVDARTNFMMEREGIKECVVCSSYMPKEVIDKSGFCTECAKTKNQISWH